jgi:hypothetical protein
MAHTNTPSSVPSGPTGSRLVRTTHAPDGTSIFASDETLGAFTPFGPAGSAFTIFDERATIPTSNNGPVGTPVNKLPRCPPAGVIFCICDFPGNGFEAPMHRTESVDYAVILSGEIVLALDGGQEKTVRAGEFIVNQGVNHKWVNRGSERCRMLCVMVGAEKVRLSDGTVLEETKLGPPKRG